MKKKKQFQKRKIIMILFIISLSILIFLNIHDLKKEIFMRENEIATIQTSGGKGNTIPQPKNEPEINSKITDWNLILVNKEHLIPNGYNPEVQMIENGYRVDKRIVEAIEKMLKDARSEGMNPWICSSYRSSETQVKLFQNQVNKYINQGYGSKKAEEMAASWVAIPRTSEHEIGLSLDIVDREYQLLDEEQANRPTQKWLKENCTKYGFILRYEEDKQDKTKVNHEPWHYRYVGIENAKFMKEKEFCLEEFIEYLKDR